MGGRKGRDGLFPATSCIKITGVFSKILNCLKNKFTKILGDNGDTITIRSCALDSGTLTTDTELVRMSHCGGFHYNNRYLKKNYKKINKQLLEKQPPSCKIGDAKLTVIRKTNYAYTQLTTLFVLKLKIMMLQHPFFKMVCSKTVLEI